MSMREERYNPVSRCMITRRVSDLASEKLASIKSKPKKTDTDSVTVDTWTDRTIRGFLGVTANFMELDRSSPRLQTVLLK